MCYHSSYLYNLHVSDYRIWPIINVICIFCQPLTDYHQKLIVFHLAKLKIHMYKWNLNSFLDFMYFHVHVYLISTLWLLCGLVLAYYSFLLFFIGSCRTFISYTVYMYMYSISRAWACVLLHLHPLFWASQHPLDNTTSLNRYAMYHMSRTL